MRKLTIIVLSLVLLAGCIQPAEGIHVYNHSNENTNEIEKILREDERLKGANIIMNDDMLVVGVTVTTFSRFHKSKIEKELSKKIESLFPNSELILSADNKIVHNTKKIIHNNNKETLRDDLEKIASLVKEET